MRIASATSRLVWLRSRLHWATLLLCPSYFAPSRTYAAHMVFAPLTSPLGWSGCGVVCIEPLCRSAPVIWRRAALLPPIWQGWFVRAAGCLFENLQPPNVMLLSPRLLAGPVSGSSALSHSVARHLLFCTSLRLCRPYGHDGLLELRPSALSHSVALPLFFYA